MCGGALSLVGYVYSFDSERGYNYILIKAYDAESLDYADKDSDCDLYRVEREKGSYVYAKTRVLRNKLTLKQVKSIAALVADNEADDDYPTKIAWEIIPGGNVNGRSAEDAKDMRYVPTEVLDTNASYVNVSDFCFEGSPSELEGSFCVHILRQLCHACGIYADDTFAYFSEGAFCTADMAHYERAVFGTDILHKRFKGKLPMPKRQSKISKEAILKALSEIGENPMPKGAGAIPYIAYTERSAGIAVAKIFKDTLEGSLGMSYLSKEIKHAMKISYDKLCMIQEDFAKVTGCKKADMKYLSLTELHEIFVYAQKALDAPKLIAKKRRRRAYQSKMPVPTVLYKGKLY